MGYVPHNNPSTPAAHHYYVAGRVVDGEREYVYCMTSGQPTVDFFIRDLGKAIRFPSVTEFVDRKKNCPGLLGLPLWPVCIEGEVVKHD